MYSTRDLGLSAYLVTLGFALLSIDPDPERPGRVRFVFESTEATRAAGEDFARGAGVCVPKLLVNALRNLKFRADCVIHGRGAIET